MIVVDASVAAMWFLPDQKRAAADRVLQETELAAPVIIAVEMASLLLRDVRRGVLSVPDYVTALAEKLPAIVAYEDVADLIAVAAICAARYGGAVYDACYIALAQRFNATLVTADRQQAEVARKAGIKVRFI